MNDFPNVLDDFLCDLTCEEVYRELEESWEPEEWFND